jgi:phospholipid/cholesterol/gamma-HCH transport system substrate-binding protein
MAVNETEEKGFSPAGRVAAFAALALALVLVGLLVFGGGSGYTVKAHFQTAGQLVKGNLVQTAGHKIGLVKDIHLTEDGQAEITLEIEDRYAPLRNGTQATIRQASLSGVANRYVDLQLPAGDEQEEIADGGIIPIDQTTTAVDLDQLFGLFDKRARKGLSNVVRGFGASYEGQAKAANAGWEYLTPSLVASRRLFQELSYDRRVLQSFLVSNSKLVTDLAERRDDVTRLVDGLSRMFGAIGEQKTSLQQAISELPPFMRRANSTFLNLRATLDDLDPLVEESIPVTPKLARVVGELRPFAKEARPTFRNLADLVRRRGGANDLIELAHAVIDFNEVATKPKVYNGKERPGSFATSTESLRTQTPQFAFQRPYTVDLTGWFDDFSHSGIYDANGSASRVATTVSAFAFLNGELMAVPENLRGETLGQVAALGQRNRCPGSTERPADDGGNPYLDPSNPPIEEGGCDPSQIPPGP